MPETQLNLLRTVEGVNHSLNCALQIFETIQIAMEADELSRTYLDALFGLWEYIRGLNDELETSVEAVYGRLRKGSEA